LAETETSAQPTGADRSLYFEDCRVGQRFTSGVREVTAADHEAFTRLSGDRSAVHVDDEAARAAGFPGQIMHGPYGIAAVFGLLDLDFRFRAPIMPGDSLRLEVILTRCRATSKPGVGVVGRHLALLKGDGTVAQEGTSTILVSRREEGGGPLEAHRLTDFAAPAWAEALVDRLGADDGFVAATGTFDGSIGLAAGRERVQLRIYRGRVIDVARTTPKGPTFTVSGSELAWTELALAPRNDYIPRAMNGRFEAAGDMYEYQRMTKAVILLWDAVRAMAAEAGA
jgi:acyl dehydratase